MSNPETERFTMPTAKQLFDMALLFNEGIDDRERLVDMVGMAMLILDRLYENGDISIKCSKEEPCITK